MPKRDGEYRGRQTLNLSVDAPARTRLRAFCESTGRSQQHVAGKLVDWFTAQPPTVQRVVMGDYADMEEEHAAALEALAAQIRKKKPKG